MCEAYSSHNRMSQNGAEKTQISAASSIKMHNKWIEGLSSGWRQIVGHVFYHGFILPVWQSAIADVPIITYGIISYVQFAI